MQISDFINLEKYPIVNDLINILDLEVDGQYYRAVAFADKLLPNGSLPYRSFIDLCEKEYPNSKVTSILSYLISQKICSITDLPINNVNVRTVFKGDFEAKISGAKSLAISLLGKIGFIPKTDLIYILSNLGYDNAEHEIAFWVSCKICNYGFAAFGKKKHISTEIVFVGDTPF